MAEIRGWNPKYRILKTIQKTILNFNRLKKIPFMQYMIYQVLNY